MNINEVIEMLEVLKSAAFTVSDNIGKEATLLDNVKLDSFTWVIDETIRLLKNKEPHILEKLTLAQQKVMKIMRDEPNEAYITYRGGFVEGLDLAIKLTKETINND